MYNNKDFAHEQGFHSIYGGLNLNLKQFYTFYRKCTCVSGCHRCAWSMSSLNPFPKPWNQSSLRTLWTIFISVILLSWIKRMQWIRSPGYEDIKSRATGTGIQSNVDRDQSNGYPDSKQPLSELKPKGRVSEFWTTCTRMQSFRSL